MIFENLSSAEDRTARSFYRRFLIETKRGNHEAAAADREKARKLRGKVLDGRIDEGSESMETYDDLVVYYNK